MKHKGSGKLCLVYHSDGDGQCIECERCGKWIRPKDWNTECEARRMKMYYLISKSEDGGYYIIECESEGDLMHMLGDQEDLKTEARIEFVTTLTEIENDNSDYLNKRLLINGEIIIPKAVEIVKRWEFDD